jgi:peroxiredoxin
VLNVGELAPDFQLPSTKGSFMLSALRGQQYALVIFYPKDDTPG